MSEPSERTCDRCGHYVATDARFCRACGAAVEATATLPHVVASRVARPVRKRSTAVWLIPIIATLCIAAIAVAFFLWSRGRSDGRLDAAPDAAIVQNAVAGQLPPYVRLVERIARLREFAATVSTLREPSGARPNIGALPIRHMRLRSLPVMMVHGHDRNAVLEVKDFLRAKYPFVDPVMMALETLGGATLPEKFERLAAEARGAIAVLTPDDIGAALSASPQARARQNVVLEIGWFWGRLGRGRCLLMSRGPLEMPSDLSGVDCLEYIRSPREHFHSLMDFIARLESLESGMPHSRGSLTPATDDERVAGRSNTAAPTMGQFGRKEATPGSIEPTMACSGCGAVNPFDSRFCEQCGAAVAVSLSA